jgi:phenylpropionate dioxygenase-like ring-hydroxylating dioxygenase large terminal subunit
VRIPQNDDGAIPAGACVPAYRCEARYGYAWVALDDPLQPIMPIPEDGAPGYRRIEQFDERWKAGRAALDGKLFRRGALRRSCTGAPSGSSAKRNPSSSA